MNVVFLIPVRHEASVNDYDHTWQLLMETLGSLANQTSSNWHAVVVANTILPIPSHLPAYQMTFLELKRPFIGRSPTMFVEAEFNAHLVDKATRRYAGITTALQKNLNPQWYFMADADDYVADDLVESIMSTTEAHHKVVTVDKGLLIDIPQQKYLVADNFNDICGTSIAVHSSLVHQYMKDGTIIGDILGQHSFAYLRHICKLSERHSLGGIPRAAYTQHSQNHGRNIWNYNPYLAQAAPLTEKIRQTFGILG